MADTPIIFSGPMVRALLAEAAKPGSGKTQTRRMAWTPYTPKPSQAGRALPQNLVCLPGRHGSFRPSTWQNVKPGDRLWVRESCRAEEREEDGTDGVRFAANDDFVPIRNSLDAMGDWQDLFYYRGRGKGRIGNPVPAIHMPRWASRLTLTVTLVRRQRLQDLSPYDARAEGVKQQLGGWYTGAEGQSAPDPRAAFALLWNSLHGPRAWDDNPELVALTFTVALVNIDALEAADAA